MPSKLDLLREGQAIEFEPGLSGRLNKEKKTLELSNGRVLNVANDKDYFPTDQSQVKMSKQREYAEKGSKGPVGEFLHQYTSQGVPGGIGDWPAYLTQTGEDYAQRKAANAEVSQRISKESPFISGAATGANIATDLALTRGMSALKAAPLLTLGSAGSRIATEPENVAAETAASAVGGKLLDIGGNWASKVASRRAASRAIPGQQQAVREANALRQEEFNFLKQSVKDANESKLQQHQVELNSRQNQMIDAQNAYEQAKIARDAEVIKLKNQYDMAKATRSSETARLEAEYKAAKSSADAETKRLQNEFKESQKRYEQSVKEMPRLQAEAQKEYSKNVIQRVGEIEKSFPKGSRITTNELDVAGFVDSKLAKTGLAGSTEAAQANRILKSLFPEGETLTANELASRYKAIEDAIQRSNPELKNILNEFKIHIGQKIPTFLSNNMAYERVFPSLVKQLDNEIDSVFKKFPQQMTLRVKKEVETSARSNIKKYFDELTPAQFVEKIKNGEFKQEVMDHLFSEGGKNVVVNGKVIGEKKLPDYVKVMEDMFRGKLDNAIARAELKMIAVESDAAKRLGSNVKRTQGFAEPVALPNPPIPNSPMAQPIPPGELPPVTPINTPPPILPPLTPPIPPKPKLAGMPQAPTPIVEPTLTPPQGFSERAGDLFEKKLTGGTGLVNNPIAKLAGLKYLLGSAALPAEAAYVGMNALTSPGLGGQIARMTFKQGGIRAIESWAQRYPSFHDGILENPQERRSLTKEIEDSSDIPIEQKAILQSKVNRGKPIQDRL